MRFIRSKYHIFSCVRKIEMVLPTNKLIKKMQVYKDRFAPFVQDGEKFICIPSQSGKPTIEPSADEQLVGGTIVNNAENWGFLVGGILYKTSTSVCKALLDREGQTNEWRGPKHVYIYRNGTWRRFDTIIMSV